MTKEEKQLLLKDLTARLSYNIKVNYADKIYEVLGYSCNDLIIKLPFLSNLEAHPIETCKPYLRPIESMTDIEKKELNDVLEFQYYSDDSCMCEATDWLNSHHFDYRELIEKGLAIEAPECMYNFK